jgi:hypothetical protein
MTDAGADGTVDTITLTYSETLTNVTDSVVTAKNKISGEAITVTSTTIPGSAATATVNLDTSDGDNYTGVIQLTYSNAQVNKIKDIAGSPNNAVSLTDYDATDDAIPAMISAVPITNLSTLKVTFSEI